MRVEVSEKTGIRRASARMQEAGVVHVKVPRHWPKKEKQRVIEELVGRIRDKHDRQKKLLDKETARQARITLRTEAELIAYVQQLNAETFNAPLGKIKIGYAKYNHLAQVNLRTRTMTVSRYCLNDVPAQALRYLIVHELAHYFEPGHDPKFWALVAQFVPDHRLQSRVIKAVHHQAVIGEDPEAVPQPLDENESDDSDLWETFEPDFEPASQPDEARTGTADAFGEPSRTKSGPLVAQPDASLITKSGPLAQPGFFDQLKLWGL